MQFIIAAIAISEIRRMFDPAYDNAMKSGDEVKERLDMLDTEEVKGERVLDVR